MSEQKSPGQRAYEANVMRVPKYLDGTPRKSWDELSEIAKWTWERPDESLPTEMLCTSTDDES